MEPVKIAIADDHKLFRQGLGQILARNEDYQVVLEAASGEELLEEIGNAAPDVVLLDLFMKGMDGKEGAGLLLKQYPDVKIIILSKN